MTKPIVLLLGDPTRYPKALLRDLREAGYIPIVAEGPSFVRVIQPIAPGIDNAAAKAAFELIKADTGYNGDKTRNKFATVILGGLLDTMAATEMPE